MYISLSMWIVILRRNNEKYINKNNLTILTMEIDITKLTSKGQVVIPQEIREGKKLKPGERFLVYDIEDSIVLKRISNLEGTKNIKEFEKIFSKTWKIAKSRGINKKDVEKEIADYRKDA